VATLLGLTGALKGQVILTMEEPLAMKLASAILMGIEVTEYNEMAESGVCEMVNMIAGEASRRLHELGYPCDLSVPSIIRGDQLEIGMQPRIPIFLIRFATEYGPVQMLLGLES
jgi:chemotaxis protein CheX